MSPNGSRQRLSPEARLDALAAAASRLLMRTSFDRLQMADVAKEMGVAVGTVYRFVESKDALLSFVVRRALDGPWTPEQLPLPAASVEEIAGWLEERMQVERDFRLVEAALARRRPPKDVHNEVAGIAGEFFDVLDRVRAVAAMLALSATEFPQLGAVFVSRRALLLEKLQEYTTRRAAAGRLRPEVEPVVAARLVFELIGWAAIRRGELPIPGHKPDRDALRTATVQMVVHALIPDRSEQP